MIEEIFREYPRVEKVWGTEIILTNTPDYCAKLLLLKSDMQCSLHCHISKDETFFVLEGQVGIRRKYPDCAPYTTKCTAGAKLRMVPGVYHQFWSADGMPAVMLEVSTHHSDEDVQRLSVSGPVEPF